MQYLIYLILKGLIFSLSVLPFWILHRISDLLYTIVYYLIPYRKKVVRKNLKSSFPDKSLKEIIKIEKGFYKHLCDLMIESLKAFTISEKEIKKRHYFTNPELVKTYVKDGKNLAIIGPHYNNWEWFILSLPLLKTPKKLSVLIMYSVLKNPYMEKLIKQSRTRMGTIMFPKKETMRYVANHKESPHMLCFAADQAPNNPYNSYWMKFLGKETGVFFGVEKISKSRNLIPIFCHVRKTARSKYEITLEIITEEPRETPYGFITEQHMKMLEKNIIAEPQYWLWTHKRWKKSKPADFEEKRTKLEK